MKIILTGPKYSGKSQIGKLFSQSISLPFFETDEMIEQLFKKEQGKALSCRAICSEYGEDFFRGYERRVIKQISEYDFCVISTGGSALLNKESRELLRKNSILALLYASISNLLERLSKKDVPSFLNDKNSRNLFAARASLVIETLRPLADIVIDSSEMDMNKTLNVLIGNLRNISELPFRKYLNNKNSALIFLGQSAPSKFLFSLNEKLITKPEIKKDQFTYTELSGIIVKREELSDFGSSWISLASVELDKELMELVVNVHKKYLIGTDREKIDVLFSSMAGVFARNILKNIGIEINTTFTPAWVENHPENLQNLFIELSVDAIHKNRLREFFSAISMFFLFCVNIELKENEQPIPDDRYAISFKLKYPLADEEKILAEIINLYIALIIFNILY